MEVKFKAITTTFNTKHDRCYPNGRVPLFTQYTQSEVFYDDENDYPNGWLENVIFLNHCGKRALSKELTFTTSLN